MFKKLNKMKIGARLKKSFRQIILIFGILSALVVVIMLYTINNYGTILDNYAYPQGDIAMAMNESAEVRAASRGISQLDDAEDLVSVYSDKNALPFFNSDNCHGDNFYYPNEDRMRQAIKFWLSSYSSKWFVRWTIIDKEKHEAIGTIEVFHRSANDNFNHVGVLRLDLKSEYETSEEIFTIMNLIVPPTFDLFECEEIITKVPVYAVERIEAMKRVGFKKSTKLLVGTMDGYAYKDYWTINRGVYIPLDDLEAKEKA